MGLRDRLGLTARTTPSAIAQLDLRPTRQRISRPVTFTGSSAAMRMPADLTALTGEGFSGSAIVYRCAQGNAAAMAALDLSVDTVAPDGTSTPNVRHPIAQLFNRNPNPNMSARTFKEVLWLQLELAGEAFVYVDRGETGAGQPTGLWPIYDPVEVVVDRATAGSLKGYRVLVEGGRRVPLLPAEVLWIRYPHPAQAWGCISPLRAASFAVDLDTWAKAWQMGELRNGARPEGVVYLGDVDPDVHDAAVADFESRHRGPQNASRHVFTSGPVRAGYDRIGLTPAEMSYLDSRRVNAEEIAVAFGYTMDELTGGATFENRRAAKVNRWTDVLLPKLEVVAGEVDRQLLPDLALSARFVTDHVDALNENQDSIVKRTQQLMYVDALLVDEARATVGLDPLANGRGQFTLTAFRQAELDSLPGALTEAEAVTRAAVLALSAGRDAPDRVPVRHATEVRARRVEPLSPTQVQRQYDRLEAAGLKVAKRLAEKQRRVVMAKVAKEGWRARADAMDVRLEALAASFDQHRGHLDGGAARDALALEVRQQVADVFDVPYWTEFTRDALAPFIGSVFDAGSSATGAALGLNMDQLDLLVLVAMDARLDTLVGQVTETTRRALEDQLLLPGVATGESIPDLADRLTSVFTTLGDSRARTIARTESVGGFNQSSQIAAETSGVVSGKVWMAASDDRVRDSHVNIDGETVGLQDAFSIGVRFPGDPAGAAKETVNCRCVLQYELGDD